MLQLSFFYHSSQQSGHYQSLFEIGYVMSLEQIWTVFGQDIMSKNVVFCIFQLCELSHERKLILFLLWWLVELQPVDAALFLKPILLNKLCVQNESLKLMNPSSISGCRSIRPCATAITADWETTFPRKRTT